MQSSKLLVQITLSSKELCSFDYPPSLEFSSVVLRVQVRKVCGLEPVLGLHEGLLHQGVHVATKEYNSIIMTKIISKHHYFVLNR